MLEGMDKKNSYDLFWLDEDIMTMGCMFEYSNIYANQLYGYQGEFDRIKFAEVFMNSGIRAFMETGHPGLLSEAVEDVFVNYVDVDLHKDLEQFRPKEPLPSLHENQLYWVGAMYAYMHYEEDIRSSDLIKKLPLKEMLHFYITGHQLDYAGAYDKLKEAFRNG